MSSENSSVNAHATRIQAFIRGALTRQQVGQMVEQMIQDMIMASSNHGDAIDEVDTKQSVQEDTTTPSSNDLQDKTSFHEISAAVDGETEEETTDEEEVLVEEEEEILLEEEEIVEEIVEEQVLEKEVVEVVVDTTATSATEPVIVEEWPRASPKRKLRKEWSVQRVEEADTPAAPQPMSPTVPTARYNQSTAPTTPPASDKSPTTKTVAATTPTSTTTSTNNNPDNVLKSPTLKDRTKNFWKAASKKDVGGSVRKLNIADDSSPHSIKSSGGKASTVSARYQPTTSTPNVSSASTTKTIQNPPTLQQQPSNPSVATANANDAARPTLAMAGMKREPSSKSVLQRYPAAGNENTSNHSLNKTGGHSMRSLNGTSGHSLNAASGHSMSKTTTADRPSLATAGMKREPSSKSVLSRYPAAESNHSTRSLKNTGSGGSTRTLAGTGSGHSARSVLANAGMKREPSSKSVLNRYPAAAESKNDIATTIKSSSHHSIPSTMSANKREPIVGLANAGMKREASSKSVLNRYPAAAEDSTDVGTATKNASERAIASIAEAKREPTFSLANAGMKREPSSKSVLNRYPAADSANSATESTAKPSIKKEMSSKSVLSRFPVANTSEKPHQSSRPTDFPKQRSKRAGRWNAFGGGTDQTGPTKAKTVSTGEITVAPVSVSAANEPRKANSVENTTANASISAVISTATPSAAISVLMEASATPQETSTASPTTSKPFPARGGSVRSRYNPYSTMAKREKPDINREPSSKEVLNRYDGASTLLSNTPKDRPSLESAPMGGSISNRWNPASSNTLNSGGSTRNITLPGKKRNKSGWNVFGGEQKSASSRKIVSCDDVDKKEAEIGGRNVVENAQNAIDAQNPVENDNETGDASDTTNTEAKGSAVDMPTPQEDDEEPAPSTEGMSTVAASLDILDHADVLAAAKTLNGIVGVEDGPPQIHEFESECDMFHTGRMPDWWMEGVAHDVLDECDVDPALGYYLE